MTRILIAFIILFLLSTCSFGAETIKATGTVRARIIAPEVFEVPTVENLTQENAPYVIVYTEQGATAQIVF